MSRSRKDEEVRKLETLLLEGLKSGEESSINREFWREIKIQATHILKPE